MLFSGILCEAMQLMAICSQNSEGDQQESQASITALLQQIIRNTDPIHGSGSHSRPNVQRRRRGSPVRRKGEDNVLAVSP
jgi:hypothetical protein